MFKMELSEIRDKPKSFTKYPFRLRINKLCIFCLPKCCLVQKRYCTALFICSGLLLTHAMRTTLAVTAVLILDGRHTDSISLNSNDKVIVKGIITE